MNQSNLQYWFDLSIAAAQIATCVAALYWRGRALTAEIKLDREKKAHKLTTEAKLMAIRADPNVRKGDMFVFTGDTGRKWGT